MEDVSLIKKNLLDLHFHKHLTIISTSIIIAFTYLIGVTIAFMTGQINIKDLVSMAIFAIFSIAILGLCSVAFFNSLFHIKNIPKVLKKIKENS